MFITSPLLSGQHPLLNDTGAQFSAIAKKLALQHRLPIVPPAKGEPRFLAMAERTKVVRRIGTVTIPITVHYRGGKYKAPYECRKKFEVLDMDYDFIIGVDLLPRLFPYDDIIDYVLLPSRISSPPIPLNAIEHVDVGEVPLSSAHQFNDSTTIEYLCDTDDHRIATAHHCNAIRDYVHERLTDYYVKLSDTAAFVACMSGPWNGLSSSAGPCS